MKKRNATRDGRISGALESAESLLNTCFLDKKTATRTVPLAHLQ
jgi:hypothetical protein